MREEIKCPHCGGNRYENIDAKTVKCLYCGSVFVLSSKIDEYEKIKKEKEADEFLAELGKNIPKTRKSENMEDIIKCNNKNEAPSNEVKWARLVLLLIVLIIIMSILYHY